MTNEGLPADILEMSAAQQGLISEANNMLTPKISNLFEAVGADEEQVNKFRAMLVENGMRLLKVQMLIVQRGGNIHKVDHKATAKRRARNKAARKQRRINRD